MENDYNLVDISSGLYLNKNISIINRKENQNEFEKVIFPLMDNKSKKKYLNKYFSDKQKDLDDITIIIPEGLRHSNSLDLDNPAIIQIFSSEKIKVGAKIIALAIKIPGIPSYSSYNTIARFAPILTSMDNFKKILDYLVKEDLSIYERVKNNPAMYKTFDGIPKKYLLIQFYEDIPKKLKETAYYEMKNLINEDTQSFFIEDFIQSSKKFTFAAEIFFIVIGFVSVVLSFFLIMISFYSNIKDNLCEYGILR